MKKNLNQLFELQKKMDDHVYVNHPELKGKDNLDWKIMALIVEVSECANEWRGFKKWSHNQEQSDKTLEEYVDGLHMVLSVGLEIKAATDIDYSVFIEDSALEQFQSVFSVITFLNIEPNISYYYKSLVGYYLGLGELLGFSWEEIVRAYKEKNQINHNRQDNGY